MEWNKEENEKREMGFQSSNTWVQPETTSFTVRSSFIFRSILHIHEFGIISQIEGNIELQKKKKKKKRKKIK